MFPQARTPSRAARDLSRIGSVGALIQRAASPAITTQQSVARPDQPNGEAWPGLLPTRASRPPDERTGHLPREKVSRVANVVSDVRLATHAIKFVHYHRLAC